MSKDIKEYLHYYLGQEFKMTKASYWAVHELHLSGDRPFVLTGKLIDFFTKMSDKVEFKPILRKLESMTEEEAVQLFDLIAKGPSISNEAKAYQVKEMICTNKFYNGTTNLSGSDWVKIFDHLVSRGFWPFGDDWFDGGLIIDKETLKG